MHGVNVVVGNGFLGSAITSELNSSVPTLMLGRNPNTNLASAKSVISVDFASTLKSLGAIDTLFWAAGPSSPFKVEQQPNLAMEHISYVKKILSSIDVERIIYCSSGGAVYGNSEPGIALSETHSLKPLSVYGKMHMQIENFLKTIPNVTCLRISNLYGISQQPQQQQGLIAYAIRAAKLNIPFDIYGTGEETRDYISIESAARQAVMLSKLKTPTVINLGTGVATSTNQILNIISTSAKVKIQKNYHPKRNFDVEHNLLDISRLRKFVSTEVKSVVDVIPLLLEPIN